MYNSYYGYLHFYGRHLSFFFIIVTVYLIESQFLSNMDFYDRSVNVLIFTETDTSYKYHDASLLSFFTRELLWDFILTRVSNTFGVSVSSILDFVYYFSLIVMCIYIKRNSGTFSMFLIFNPLIIDFTYSQSRMAFAFSFLLIGMMLKARYITFIMFLVAVSLHTSMTLYIALYISITLVCRNYFNSSEELCVNLTSKFFYIAVFLGVILAIVLGPFRESILTAVNDRRAVYQAQSSSIAYMLPWLLFTFLLFTSVIKVKVKNLMGLSLISCFIMSVFFNFYGIRFLATSLPFIIIYLASLTNYLSLFLKSMVFLIISFLMWSYWLKLDYL